MSGTSAADRWPIERENKLRELVPLGLSASQMAVRMGDGISRNSIIGFMRRNGIKSLNPPGDNRILPADPSKPRRVNTRRKKRALAAGEYRKSLMELTPTSCRYPLWPETERSGFYCGAEEADMPGRPYCPHHTYIATRGHSPGYGS